MIIVANSSPLIALGRIQRFDIINTLFGQIYIPTTVYRETVIETSFEEQRNTILSAIENSTIVIVSQQLIIHSIGSWIQEKKMFLGLL